MLCQTLLGTKWQKENSPSRLGVENNLRNKKPVICALVLTYTRKKLSPVSS